MKADSSTGSFDDYQRQSARRADDQVRRMQKSLNDMTREKHNRERSEAAHKFANEKWTATDVLVAIVITIVFIAFVAHMMATYRHP
ncbi:hypothetical protein OHA77_24955 [Streptosporangium sp. NBC_01639]|uniref:hypothetical protein n=1 Tax=Streptosporangium sp. NBC_01639 TaxID=2975948 RepID=UPI00386830C8|nr:hypothetical protein OHA77_24955 [Streptosporangium sp. NBC_01639]